MKMLTIVRHAKSSWKDPTLDDHQRPLKKRGKRDAKEMGRRLAARSVIPDHIISSDARRAVDTAVAITRALGIPANQIHLQPALYHMTDKELVEMVGELSDAWTRVMLFGHNPTLTDFVNRFLRNHLPNLPTSGIVELHFDCASWRDVDPRNVAYRHVDFPKKDPNLGE